MSSERANLQELLSKLAGENLLEDGWDEHARELIDRERNEQAWYVRVMVGFSAWLASWMLIGFVVGAAVIDSESATLILGAVLVTGSVFGRRFSENDFITQMCLAVCLAGEGLIVYGIAEITNNFVTTTVSFIILETLLIAFYRDVVHRFLSAASIVVAITGLLFEWKAIDWVHAVVIGFAMLFIYLIKVEPKLLCRGQANFIIPVRWGVLLGQLSVLMLSTIYVLPELAGKTRFFPNPWISSIGLGLVFFYVVDRIIRIEEFPPGNLNKAAIYGFCVLIVAMAIMVPGLIMALIVLLLGFVMADRVLLGFAIGFFAVFLAAFFYGIEITLLMKSMVLIATAAVLLAGRFILKRFAAARKEAGTIV